MNNEAVLLPAKNPAGVGAGRQFGVLRQVALGIAGLRRNEPLLSAGQFLVRKRNAVQPVREAHIFVPARRDQRAYLHF